MWPEDVSADERTVLLESVVWLEINTLKMCVKRALWMALREQNITDNKNSMII